ELAVRRFESEVLKNQSAKQEIMQKVVVAENEINFLVGRVPQHVVRQSENFISSDLDTVYTGLPAQLLENRPDIKQAEYELAAAKLNTKVAKANFYPSLGIKAGVGLQALDWKHLSLAPESIIANLVGDAVAPLINRNAIKAQYFTATNKQLAAVFEYEKTVLSAYIEVSNQLSNIKNLKNVFALKSAQVEKLTESIALSNLLFKSARADYLDVLLTQREALDAKLELLETKKAQYS